MQLRLGIKGGKARCQVEVALPLVVQPINYLHWSRFKLMTFFVIIYMVCFYYHLHPKTSVANFLGNFEGEKQRGQGGGGGQSPFGIF